MIEEAKEYIRNSSKTSKIYVGCDSKNAGDYSVFVTVIVIHINGNSGAKVFHAKERVPRISSIRWRLIQEAHYSTAIALEIKEAVGDRELTVHLDYNPSGKYESNGVIKEAIAYVMGQGLSYRIKPYAIAASSCSDYLVNHSCKFRVGQV